jgi:hypothetical protein
MTAFNDAVAASERDFIDALELFQGADEAERQTMLASLSKEAVASVFTALDCMGAVEATHRKGYAIPDDVLADSAHKLMVGYEARWCAQVSWGAPYLTLRMLLQSQSPARHERGRWMAMELLPRFEGGVSASPIETLFLNGSPVTELDFLSSFPALRWLILDNTAVEDLTPISELSELVRLSLRNCRSADFSAIAALHKLEVLTLDGAEHFGDTSALSGLDQLVELDLRGVSISDLGEVGRLKHLRRLRVGSEHTSIDLSFLKEMQELESLEVVANQLSGLEVLAELTELRSLSVNGGRVDAGIIEGLTSLTTLRVTGCSMASLDVSPLTQLEHLDISGSDTPLSGTLSSSVRILAVDDLAALPDSARDAQERGREAYLGELFGSVPAFSLVLGSNLPK